MKLRYGDDKRKKKSVDLNSDHNFRLSLQYYTDALPRHNGSLDRAQHGKVEELIISMC